MGMMQKNIWEAIRTSSEGLGKVDMTDSNSYFLFNGSSCAEVSKTEDAIIRFLKSLPLGMTLKSGHNIGKIAMIGYSIEEVVIRKQEESSHGWKRTLWALQKEAECFILSLTLVTFARECTAKGGHEERR
ncbi:hypothetical protein Tco_0138632 [Tanacetum coccineum]